MKVYLAGPEVFLADAIAVGVAKVSLCARYGLTGLFPLDNKIDVSAPDGARQIFLGNRNMMDDADAVVANLTPFRGPSADAGTVYELGYMIGGGKRAFGYCNDPDIYINRVARSGPLRQAADGTHLDRDGLIVEDFGGVDNLMINESLALQGSPLVLAKAAPADPMRDLAGFETCLRRLAGVSP